MGREDMNVVAQAWADETAEVERMDRESLAERNRRNELAQEVQRKRELLAANGIGRNIRERAYLVTQGVVIVTYVDEKRTDVRLIRPEAAHD